MCLAIIKTHPIWWSGEHQFLASNVGSYYNKYSNKHAYHTSPGRPLSLQT